MNCSVALVVVPPLPPEPPPMVTCACGAYTVPLMSTVPPPFSAMIGWLYVDDRLGVDSCQNRTLRYCWSPPLVSARSSYARSLSVDPAPTVSWPIVPSRLDARFRIRTPQDVSGQSPVVKPEQSVAVEVAVIEQNDA